MAKEIIKKTIVKKAVTKKVVTIPKITTSEVISCRYADKNIKIPPRKLRLLINSIKKLTPTVALTRLSLTNTKAARILVRAIKTVISVAKNNYNLLPENLKFESIIVNDGQKIKRMDKSHGSHFARGIIIKRHSRLVIIVKGQVK